MASFFSLGGGGDGGGRGANNQQRQGGGGGNNNNNEIISENLFLYSRNNITTTNNNNNPDQVDLQNKGFELWQPQDYGEPHHRNQQLQALYPPGLNLIPDNSRSADDILILRSGASSSTTSGGSISCQDCGNQAKKDCGHMRCRTCCKSRGFHCQTHVRSTWVPAAKRRERLQQLAALHRHRQQQDQEHGNVLHYQTLQIHPKRLKDSFSTAIPIASSGLELANFPAEVNLPAVFKCVRVSSFGNANNNQYAYQTSVNIGGHLFKGILYDQGLESGHGDHHHQLSAVRDEQINLITNTSSSSAADPAGSREGAAAPPSQLTATFLDPSAMYHSASLNSFMAGTQFFPPPRT